MKDLFSETDKLNYINGITKAVKNSSEIFMNSLKTFCLSALIIILYICISVAPKHAI